MTCPNNKKIMTNNIENNIEKNLIGGDLVCGDKYEAPSPAGSLRDMLSKLTKECMQDPNFKEYVDRLNHFLKQNQYNQRNLETKLREAGKPEEIDEALELKEKFTKFLTKNSLSAVAQEAYAKVLCKLKISYESNVKPLIKSQASEIDIDAAVYKVINEIHADLQGTLLESDHCQIKGMLYFLTGNCHIEWSY